MKHRLLLALAAATALTGCPVDDGSDPAATAETLLERGRRHLSLNEADEAFEAFGLLAEQEGFLCPANYGMFLASIQRAFNRISTIVEAAGTLLGGSPLLPQAQSFNSIIEGIIKPFENHFREIRQYGLAAIEGGCTLAVPEGYPVIIGKEGNLLYAEAVLGDEWDSAAARIVVAGVNGMQAALNFVLAHELTFDEDLDYLLDVLNEEVDAVQDYERDVAAGVTDTERRTWIAPIRAAGVFADLNPKLLAFGNDARFAEVDNNLAEMFTLIYANDEAGATGVIPDLLERNREESPEELRDNVLAWIDEGDGIAGGDDTIRIGLRKFNIASTVVMPNNPGGFELTLNSLFGDVERAIVEVHGIIDNLGDQMTAVEAGGTPPRLGVSGINAIMDAISFTADMEPIPEAVELDLRAYFVDPVPLRKVMPYWYNDGSPTKVFMVEGESTVTSPVEPFVVTGDTSHFPANFAFGAAGEVSPEIITDAPIVADDLQASMSTLTIPLPYIAWQDPSFHGVLYVNPRALPVEPEGVDGYVASTQYLTNKTTLSYVLHYTQPIDVEIPTP
jgi:hypothetical protein